MMQSSSLKRITKPIESSIIDLAMFVNDLELRRGLVDFDSSLNIKSLSTLEAVGILETCGGATK